LLLIKIKVSIGEEGRKALNGEFESTLAIHNIIGDSTPKPIAWGSFKALKDAHYYLCRFHYLTGEDPEVTPFCETIARLHKESVSPNGKFGFHITTYNGNLPQDNTYADTWEEFFVKGFKHMLKLNVARGGPWPEMERLKDDMIEKVIPRLLRPLETGGRSVRPSLVHGDLWCGNTATDGETDQPLVYDPASFYAHNECESERNGSVPSADELGTDSYS
jgi:protein-ribulosamine 3-kinase